MKLFLFLERSKKAPANNLGEAELDKTGKDDSPVDNPQKEQWAGLDSNQRKLTLMGLQPIPFSHSGTDPFQLSNDAKAIRYNLARLLSRSNIQFNKIGFVFWVVIHKKYSKSSYYLYLKELNTILPILILALFSIFWSLVYSLASLVHLRLALFCR